jgi:predicted AlkP superfamily phosphohydrolase/phosphomutase
VAKQRVLAIGLDGYEHSLAEQFMSDGELPHLDSLRARSARFLLNHGAATRTGLAWEHASTGLSPEAAGRASAVDFDTQTYEVWHAGTSLTPFPAYLDSATVVFDPPYFDLGKAPSVRGVVNWGAHDPGVSRGSRPYGLVDDLLARFGEYPARGTMYDVVWDSPERTRMFSDTLVQAVKVRSRAAHWLLAERCPDWDLAFVVAGEIHSAIENLWHGVDRDHPLHVMPSADEAGKGLRAVYRATDDLVGDLVAAFPDARVVAFSMNGMGPNHSDIASMILLPELLFRKDAGRPLLRVPARWSRAADGMPVPEKGIPWSQAVMTRVKQFPEPLDSARRIAARVLPERVKHLLRPASSRAVPSPEGVLRTPLDWMPADLYRRHWPSLRYFALPSFYDGRVRINLAGRESRGRVAAADYESVCDEVEALVRSCRDSRTGEPVVQQVVHCGRPDPMALGPTDCDLVIVWRDAALGFDHPELGRVGPLPYRRTGGHTGPHGMAYLAGDGLPRGDFGVRESFDVVPTLFSLLGEPVPNDLSGRPLI